MILAIAAANLAGPGNRSADKTPQLSVEVQSQDSQSSRYTISQRRSVWERSNKVCNQCQTPLADWRGENMRIKEVESKKDRDTVQLIGICPNCDEGPCDVEENAPSKVDEKNYRKKWSLKIREKVWKRNKERCYYCHKHLVSFRGEHMHLDHLVPFSRGGADHEDNLVPACPKCNLEKSDAEFPELR
jgi:RNase P subunit RPR2